MRKLFIIDSDALPGVGPISTRYQWCCNNGCGQCDPVLVEFRVSHMTCNGETTHEVTEPRMVSSCCGEGMFLWDSVCEDDGPGGFNGELANPEARRAAAQIGGAQ